MTSRPAPLDEDDYHEAMKWFSVLLVEQALTQGKTLEQIGRELNRHKSQVSQIAGGKLGIGMKQWMAIARWQRKQPGQLMDEAIHWWVRSGREFKATRLKLKAKEASERAKSGVRPKD
jgi:hypothetical protein